MRKAIVLTFMMLLQFSSPAGDLGQVRKPETQVVSILRDDPCGELLGVDSCFTALLSGRVEKLTGGPAVIAMLSEDPSDPDSAKHQRPSRRRVRLAQIGLPDAALPLGKEARKKLRELLLNREVSVEVFCPGSHGSGNLTAIVKVKDVVDVGLELIKAGLARVDRSVGGTIEIERCHYELAEAEAKREKRGIWQ